MSSLDINIKLDFLMHMTKNYFMKTFTEETDSQMLVVIKKAIYFKIIEKRNGLHYFIGSLQIGSSMEDLVSYCKGNESMYRDFILKQVKAQDIIPNESYPEVDQKIIESNVNAELDGLKAKAKELKIQGHALMLKPEQLKRAILKKEKENSYNQKSLEKRALEIAESNKTDVLADENDL